MKKIFAMMLAAVMCCLMLVSCGDSKYVGTYTYELLGEKMSIELKDDHTAEFMGESGLEWEVDDDKIVLTSKDGKDDDSLELDIDDDGNLSITEGGITMKFEKEDD